MSVDIEMIAAICRVGRRALAQNDATPDRERLSVRAVLEEALHQMDKIVAAGEVRPVKVSPPAPEPLVTPALPGSHYAGAARKNGCEDAYDNAMEARFGPGY